MNLHTLNATNAIKTILRYCNRRWVGYKFEFRDGEGIFYGLSIQDNTNFTKVYDHAILDEDGPIVEEAREWLEEHMQ